MSLLEQHTGKKAKSTRRTTVSAACEALGISRATWYRRKAAERAAAEAAVAVATNAAVAETPGAPAEEPASTPLPPKPPRPCPRQLSEDQETFLLALLCSEAYVDASVREVFARELHDGRYHASVSTMYRILRKHHAVRERRLQRRHAKRVKPKLTATGPNQVWTWDITKIPGPKRGRWYCLYVVIDLYSRKVVGWDLQHEEIAEHACGLVELAAAAEAIEPGKLILHADNGAPMISQDLAGVCRSLGVSRSFSRPRVSNDNAFSEAQFKTTKYHRSYPGRFESLPECRAWFEGFVDWYNREHHHVGIALFTPQQVHSGEHVQIQKVREAALDAAFERHCERFVNGRPRPKAMRLPEAVHINPEPAIATLDGEQAAEDIAPPGAESEATPEASPEPTPLAIAG